MGASGRTSEAPRRPDSDPHTLKAAVIAPIDAMVLLGLRAEAVDLMEPGRPSFRNEHRRQLGASIDRVKRFAGGQELLPGAGKGARELGGAGDRAENLVSRKTRSPQVILIRQLCGVAGRSLAGMTCGSHGHFSGHPRQE